MRARLVLFVLAIVLVFGFVALNLPDFTHTTPLNFGFFVADASVGGVMLGFLVLAMVAFLAAGAMHRTQTLIESRQYLKDLQHQRDLADKAEASRFTELRRHMDDQLKELRQRDAIAATELEKAMVNSQRELRTQLDGMHKTLAARLADMETRLDYRSRGFGPLPATATAAEREQAARDAAAVRETAAVRDAAAVRASEAAREEHRAEHERERVNAQEVRDEIREERREERAVAADARRVESGWRRWF